MTAPTTNQQRRPQQRRQRDDEGAPPASEGTAITRTALGDEAIARSGETAMTATAERAKAIVQARITQAIMRPRKLTIVRERILEDCDRPSFAKVAMYARPQGNKKLLDAHGDPVIENGREVWVPNIIEGLSIRFVEAAVQAMGNAEAGTVALYEDDKKKIVRCEVWDYERNISWPQEITIEKTVERSKLKKNQVPLSTRKNSYGENVYILPATDDEVRLKENRIVSMTLRTLGLRVVPGDIIDEAKERIAKTREKAHAAELAGIKLDPTAARKDLLDRLAKIGIRAADVVQYFGGRDFEAATPDMILEMRIIGASVISGDVTWRDVLAGSPYIERTGGDGDDDEPSDERAAAAREKIQGRLHEQLAKRAQNAAQAGAPQNGPAPAAGAPSTGPAPTGAPPAAAAPAGPEKAPPPAAQGAAPAEPQQRMRQPGED